MLFFLLLAIASTWLAVALSLRALSSRRRQSLLSLGAISRYGYQAEAPEAMLAGEAAPRLPALDRLAGSLGSRFSPVFSVGGEQETEQLLRSAGIYGFGPRKLLGYRLLAVVMLPALWLLLAHGGNPARLLLGLLFALFLGWQGPIIYIRRRARMRLEEIDYQMPELIDVLVTMIEAGVGFAGALQMAARRFEGPLGEELRLTTAEQDMGLSSDEALQNLFARADTPAVRSFVRSVLQGETLGVSIGKIMRDLADEMRKRRRQKAEERAQKAPTKLLFPLALLIFPAMFIILLGPAVINIIHSLKGMQ